MGVLRTLALVLGRAFQHLARILLSWSRGPVESSADPADWADSPDDGPPEHWLKYVGKRAPWIVRRTRPVLRSIPVFPTASAVEPGKPGPGSAAGAAPVDRVVDGAPAAAAPLVSGASVFRSGSAPAGAPEVAQAAAHLETRTAPPRDPPAASGAHPAPAAPKPAPVRATVLARGPAAAFESAAPRSPEPPRVIRPVAGRRDDEPPGPGGAGRVPTKHDAGDNTLKWPPLEREGPPARLEPAADDAGNAGPIVAPTVRGVPFVASRAFPGPVPVGGEHGATRASAQDEPEFPEEDRWPELPNTGWRGETWQALSNRSLVREQLRLTRLLAEQAGSSWSGPRS